MYDFFVELAETVMEAIENFKGRRPPTHPSPAGDNSLLRPWKKRSQRAKGL